MKSSKIILQPDNSNQEKNEQKAGAGKLLKAIIVTSMLSSMTLMYSCGVFIPAPGIYAEGEQHHRHYERRMHGEHNNFNEHHDYDEHHN